MHPRPHPIHGHTRPRPVTALAALGLLLACGAATAQVANAINVAALVTGVSEDKPASSLRTPCGSQCVWATASAVATTDSYTVSPGPLVPLAWPTWVGTRPAVQDALTEPLEVVLPATGGSATWTGLASGKLHRAEVHNDLYAWMGSARQQLSTESFRVGSGSATVSYAVRIQNTSGAPQAQWLEFSVPQALPAFEVARNDYGGSNGFTPETAHPRQQATRSAVDVVVDGLTVWSSATHRLQPRRVPGQHGPLLLRTGAGLGPQPKVLLFLGRVPAMATIHVTLLLRTDARLDAPTCLHESEFGGSYMRCHAHREVLSIPSASSLASGGQMRPVVDVFLN